MNLLKVWFSFLMLVYLHIPKCAGSTMLIYMKNYYKITQIKRWWRYNWENISLKTQCIFGHFPYGIPNKYYPKVDYITFLRNPVERIISLYYYIQNKQNHLEHSIFMKYSLTELIKNNFYSAFDNDMVRFISGKNEVAFLSPKHRTTTHDLEIAKQNLHYFKAIGFVETFDQDLKRFASVFNWNNTSYKKRTVGIRPSIENLSQKTIDLIIQNTQLDIQLYEYAKELA